MEGGAAGRRILEPKLPISGPSCSVAQFLQARHIAGQPFDESRRAAAPRREPGSQGDDQDQDEEDQDQRLTPKRPMPTRCSRSASGSSR